ncbi:MAG: GGDEF domain-containing response regulator [Candidatus Woesearchaeota archaeon]|jgi:diguanylate cyclase (GGDEF)-like protein|nr:GGDEF domain-containing response regulator [Candidatus Woesearchaeota archaeon]
MSLEQTIKILLIDDESKFTEIMKSIIQKRFSEYINNSNIKIKSLNSSISALQHLDSKSDYDLIIIDYNMPKLTGIDVIKIAREEKNINTPFVMISCHEESKYHLESRLAGAELFISKSQLSMEPELKEIFLLNLKTIIESYRNKKLLMQYATTDTLTGIGNRRKFEEILEEELRILNRTESSVAIAFIDIDNFKWVNDNLGHNRGDIYLQTIAKRLVDITKRETDFIARLGGDEFGVLMTNPNHEYVQYTLKNIYKLLCTPYNLSNITLNNPSASIGAIHYFSKNNHTNTEKLIDMADAQMFKHKNSQPPRIQSYELKTISNS